MSKPTLRHGFMTGRQLWDMVVAHVFRPIGLFYAPVLYTWEAGGARGIPRLEVGFYPTTALRNSPPFCRVAASIRGANC